MSLIIKGMKLPKHAAVNGEKDTAYKCVILAHPDNSVVIKAEDDNSVICVRNLRMKQTLESNPNWKGFNIVSLDIPDMTLLQRVLNRVKQLFKR